MSGLQSTNLTIQAAFAKAFCTKSSPKQGRSISPLPSPCRQDSFIVDKKADDADSFDSDKRQQTALEGVTNLLKSVSRKNKKRILSPEKDPEPVPLT